MTALTAVTVETMKTVALVTLAVLVVIGLVMAKVMVSMIGKIIVLVVLAVLAVAVWTQRESLQDCADKVTAKAERARETGRLPKSATCTFFGYEVEVEVPGT